jgi:exo-beta-1,3-glucanase (GH17 family)
VPTPIAYTCPTPGAYTFPATILTLTETTTVVAKTSSKVSKGTHTLGGVTTVVSTATTVVCPYATSSTLSNGVVTDIVSITSYVCPSAGTYTIAPVTVTVVATETLVIVPYVTTYCPGTYTAPAIVTTITETDTIIYCPFSTPAATTKSNATMAATTTTAAPSSSSSAVASSSASSSAAPTSSAAPVAANPNAAASGSSSSSGSSPALGGGAKWAIAYTAYDNEGNCKPQGQVASDVAAIAAAGFGSMRLYSTDCSTLDFVGPAAAAAGLKLILGVFIKDSGECSSSSGTIVEQVNAIVKWGQFGMVELIVAGNEAMAQGFCSASQLVQLITDVKKTFKGAGYTGPISTTDTVGAWQQGGASALCDVMDVMTANIHAFFNAGTSADQAGSFVASQLQIIESICPSLPAYITESGWPTAGSCNGNACPGFSEQQAALSSIQAGLGSKTTFFSFSSDGWKQPGQWGVEQYFGCASLFGA